MTGNLSDILEIWGLEKDSCLFADGSIGFALECQPIDASSWSNEAQNEYSDHLKDFLNSLPEKIDIQFVQEVLPATPEVISKYLSFTVSTASDELKELTTTRVEKLLTEIKDGLLPNHLLKVFIRRPRTASQLSKIGLFSKEEQFPDLADRELKQEMKAVAKLKDQIIEGLESLGIQVKPILSSELAALLYRQWNPDRPLNLENYDPEDIRTSLLFSDVTLDLKGFVIGHTHHRLVSLKILPDQTMSCLAQALRGLPLHSKAFVSVHVPVQMTELGSLQTQRRITYSMVAGKRNGVADLESQAKLQDLEELLERMVAQGEKVFSVSLNVLLQHQDEELLDDQVSQTLQIIRELGGAEGLVETYASFEIFNQLSLPNARCHERIKKINSSNLRDLLPLYGPWTGHKLPRVLLKNRLGSLFSFDPFDGSLTNSNQLVSGGSGAGKSFATNLILLQLIKENPQVYFIDIGGSYKRLTQILGGQNVDLGLDQNISINPFDLLPGEIEPSPHKIKFLMGLIEIMTKDSGGLGLSRLAQAEIEQAIQEVYKRTREPRLSDLKELLNNHEDPEIRKFGKILKTWTGDTPYGRFVDRPTNVHLGESIVALDLKGLESYPDLQSVCLFMITDLIWRTVQKDRSRQKYVVFDECWKLLKNESALIFIEEVFRTFRKYYASAIAISQDLCDFANSKISSALISNCSIKWILIQNQNDLSRMTEVLGLNPNEIALIQGLEQKKGHFSEAYLISGQKNRSVVVIEPTPMDLWLATTDPRDLSEIAKEKAKNPESSDWEVLKSLSQKHPHGLIV